MSHTNPTRRDFIRATAAGAAGLALAETATGGLRPPLRLGTAKSCIFINMVGGPAHLDTFDPKPDAPSDVRGPFRPIRTATPGVHVSELFPELSKLSDTFSLIRSMHHDAPPVHECGFQLLNTGRLFRDGPDWPSVGAVMSYLNESPQHPAPVMSTNSSCNNTLTRDLGPTMKPLSLRPSSESRENSKRRKMCRKPRRM